MYEIGKIALLLAIACGLLTPSTGGLMVYFLAATFILGAAALGLFILDLLTR